MLQGEFGKYRIENMVGMGGMSVVYRAHDRDLNREAALKILNLHRAANPSEVRRFKREVEIAQRLRHPNIIDIYEYGEVENFAYLAMEFMPGGSLAGRYANPVTVTLGESAQVLKDIASALDFAHSEGVLHRDLKLSNILIDSQDRLTLSDFGLALLQDASRITQSGQTFGTPLYMSPEQVNELKRIDHRADIYSLGVIAYLLATGYFPFSGSNTLIVLSQHVSDKPPLPSNLNPRLPTELDWVLLKGLAKRPEDRFDSAGALARAFAQTTAHISSTEIILLTSQPTPILEQSDPYVFKPFARRGGEETNSFDRSQGEVTPDLDDIKTDLAMHTVRDVGSERGSGRTRQSKIAARWAGGLALVVASIILIIGLGTILPSQQVVFSETLDSDSIGGDTTPTPTSTTLPSSTPTFSPTVATETPTVIPSATRTPPLTNTPRPSTTVDRSTSTLSGMQLRTTQRAEQTSSAQETIALLMDSSESTNVVPTRTRVTANATSAAQSQGTSVTPSRTTSASVPSTSLPSTNAHPTSIQSSAVPATGIPATAVQPTSVPPTSVPPTSVPPTAVPPTPVPPTPVPPTPVPPTNTPLLGLPLPTIPILQTLLPGLGL